MTSRLDDCRAVLNHKPGEPDMCGVLDEKSKRDTEARARELRALARNDATAGFVALDNSLDAARELALVIKAAGPAEPDDPNPIGTLDEVGQEEEAALDEIAGSVGRALVDDAGWSAKDARGMAFVVRGVGETLRYNLGRIRARMPNALEALAKRDARLEKRPPVYHFNERDHPWVSTGGVWTCRFHGRWAEVRERPLVGDFLLSLWDSASFGRPVKMHLLDRPSMVFSSAAQARAIGTNWLSLDDQDRSALCVSEAEWQALTQRSTSDVLSSRQRAEKENKYIMANLRQTIRRSVGIDDNARRLVPRSVAERPRPHEIRVPLPMPSTNRVVTRSQAIEAGRASLTVRQLAGRTEVDTPCYVLPLRTSIRLKMGLPIDETPALSERTVRDAINVQGNGLGIVEMPRQLLGMRYDAALDTYWSLAKDGSAPGMDSLHAVFPGVDGVRPHHSDAAIAFTKSGSNVGLHGTTAVTAVQVDQRGVRANQR